ncbi:MAG: glycine oxidase ThiO [Candidatus Caldarchaeum sp.]|nr:glycine oxidase ThiO [Candidatus Caldarchaeum sp.]MCX8201480.1 glycine oxidase ThiO [Candidatus Caldarchaeum sp.]MDW8063918.1 glycine oxidase ThiO [Candidatus Caldarchaeum sp.]MDW8434591.1 glycine oxidase ThiO [Candidatus Caldarchaeum sp.]
MIAVVGGGLIGLSVAWYLRQRGFDVVVYEKNSAGRGASWASAGMLAPNLEAEPGEENLVKLLLESLKMWPAFAQSLEKQSGIDVGYRTEGTLSVALNRDDVQRLRFQHRFMKELGLDVEFIDGETVLEQEPFINRNVQAALHSRSDHQVDARQAVEAVKKVFMDSGGVLKERCGVAKVVVEDGMVVGVFSCEGFRSFENVVLAAGPWSRHVDGLPEQERPPVRPVKGQMIAVRDTGTTPLVQHVVWGPQRPWGPCYIVPKRGGRILLGTTVEEKGFDVSVTAGGLMNILRGCWEVLPALSELPVEEVWAGLRPGSPDDAPIIGPSSTKGLFIATGHFRNGILLAPFTAKAAADYMETGKLDDLAKPFSPQRFKPRDEPG